MFDRALFFLKGARGVWMTAFAAAAARAAMTVVLALSLAAAIVGLWKDEGLSAVAGWAALFALCFIGRSASAALADKSFSRFSSEYASGLRHRYLAALFALGPADLGRRGTGGIVAEALEGADAVRAYLRLAIPRTAAMAVMPAVILVAVFCLDWVSGLIALICFPFVIIYMMLIGHSAKDEAARRHGEFDRLSGQFMDTMRGIDTVEAMGAAQQEEAAIFDASERFRRATMKTLRIAALSGAVLDLFATLVLAGVAIMLGFRLVDGSVAFFPALCALILLPEFFIPVREFAADYHASLNGKTSLAAIGAVIEEAAERQPDAFGDGGRIADTTQSDSEGAQPFVRLEAVTVVREGRRTLDAVTIEAKGPLKVGIVGPSGSGKSTLIDVLGGFLSPSDGAAIFDTPASGEGAVKCWQRRVMVIPQNPCIFHAPLRENVSFYRPDASGQSVDAAIAALNLETLAAQAGDEPLGSGGRGLSGGQAQRVALARAFLDPRRDVLLFDEPTAHLDIETELELKEPMLKLMEGRLVFFATHRLHWMADMDWIIQLEEGSVIWQGPAALWPKTTRAAEERNCSRAAEAGARSRTDEAGAHGCLKDCAGAGLRGQGPGSERPMP